jgi:hypothetical protein
MSTTNYRNSNFFSDRIDISSSRSVSDMTPYVKPTEWAHLRTAVTLAVHSTAPAWEVAIGSLLKLSSSTLLLSSHPEMLQHTTSIEVCHRVPFPPLARRGVVHSNPRHPLPRHHLYIHSMPSHSTRLERLQSVSQPPINRSYPVQPWFSTRMILLSFLECRDCVAGQAAHRELSRGHRLRRSFYDYAKGHGRVSVAAQSVTKRSGRTLAIAFFHLGDLQYRMPLVDVAIARGEDPLQASDHLQAPFLLRTSAKDSRFSLRLGEG